MPVLWVFETDVFVVLKGLFAIKNVENRFFNIYFYDLLHANTGGYKGLHGVTRGYRVSQEVTEGDKRLKGVTGGDKRLKGVTRGYMGLQRIIETFF